MKWVPRVALAIGLMMSIGVAAHYWMGDGPHQTAALNTSPIARWRRHCLDTRNRLDWDALQLRGEYGRDQSQPAINLHLQLVHESPADVGLCSATPPDLSRLDACYEAMDYQCLARLASTAAASIPTNMAEADTAAALARMRGHCEAVRDAFRADAADFESPDERLRRRAEQAFLSYRSLHSAYDIELCSPYVPDLTQLYECSQRDDYSCLARLARLAEQSIYIP